MYRETLHWFAAQDPLLVVVAVLLVVDLTLYLRSALARRLAARRCRLGFHTCCHCSMVLVVSERRDSPASGTPRGREIDQKDMPPGLRDENNHPSPLPQPKVVAQ